MDNYYMENQELIIKKTGKVVEYNGKYWGIVYEDGHSTTYDWTTIDKAYFSDSKFFTRPSDITYKNSPYVEELNKGRIAMVEITTIYKVI